MSQDTKTRTITLTDRRPVKIIDADWAIIASDSDHDGQVEVQANHVWWIKVREHADGRRIVYGRLAAGNGGVPIGWQGWAGGHLIPAGSDPGATIDAIRKVADGINCSEMAARVIADLPAEEI